MNEALESIYAYTRAEAIEAGEQFDAGSIAEEIGFRFPVFLTRAVWLGYIVPPEGLEGQDIAGRLRDTLRALQTDINKGGAGTDMLYFLVKYQLPSETRLRGYEAIKYAKQHNLTLSKYSDSVAPAREGLTVEEAADIEPYLIYIDKKPAEKPQFETTEIQLVAVVGPVDNDDPRPALTIMLPGEENTEPSC